MWEDNQNLIILTIYSTGPLLNEYMESYITIWYLLTYLHQPHLAYFLESGIVAIL